MTFSIALKLFATLVMLFLSSASGERLAAQSTTKPSSSLLHGHKFNDCNGANWCPKMIVIRGDTFVMGSRESEAGRNIDEGPRRKVNIRKFAVGQFEITFAEWDACVNDGGCGGYQPSDQGWGRSAHPVINVSWEDAQSYVKWLSKKTGKAYRLLSEAEWEYVASAKRTTYFWWGNSISTDQANYNGDNKYGLGDKGVNRKQTVPVNSFKPNPFGLYNVNGNVWEWVEDCFHRRYKEAPTDGSAWLEANGGNCTYRIIRGGGWVSFPENLRSRERTGHGVNNRNNHTGFRVARTL